MARYQPAERDARYRKARKAGRMIIVSEGDSWFDYPMCLNIIDQLDDERRFALKRLEYCGDTVRNMVGAKPPWKGVESLRTVVEHERPRAVLFSGGGNDIIGDNLKDAIRNYDPTNTPEWHLDTPVWRDLTRDVETGYRKLITSIGPLCPVIAHGYDYFIPADKPVKYDGIGVSGPWVWKEMNRAGIPDGFKTKIARVMIRWFNDLLDDLADEYPSSFGYIDLTGTLGKDDWANEIHPSRSGFKLIFQKYLTELDAKLSPLLIEHDKAFVGSPP